jgi:hypothetical protein
MPHQQNVKINSGSSLVFIIAKAALELLSHPQKTDLDFWQPEVAGFKKRSQKLTGKSAKNRNVKRPIGFRVSGNVKTGTRKPASALRSTLAVSFAAGGSYSVVPH